MKLTGKNGSTWGKTCPSAILSTTNRTWTDPGSYPSLRGKGRLLTAWAMARHKSEVNTCHELYFVKWIFWLINVALRFCNIISTLILIDGFTLYCVQKFFRLTCRHIQKAITLKPNVPWAICTVTECWKRDNVFVTNSWTDKATVQNGRNLE